MTTTGRGSLALHLALSPMCLMAAAAAPLALVAPAYAQISDVTPYFAVVSADDALLRSGDRDLLYPVAKLTRGQILRVDGQGPTWVRVSYPPATSVLIPADSVQLDASGKTAVVTKPSRLKAANMTIGARGSWKDVLDQPMAAGAKVSVIQAEAGADGKPAWYRIVPPDSARAYAPLAALQRASQEQIAAYTAAQATKPAESRPAPATAATPAGPSTLTDPMVPPAGGATAAVPPAPTGAQASPTGQPAEAAPTVIAQRPVTIPPSPYEQLEAAFEAMRKQPADQAEYKELMNEYQAAIAKLDDSPQNQYIRPRLQLRLDYLKLQADVQDQLRKLEEAQRSVSESEKQLAARLAEVDRVRQYTIVGRLSASTIYDGKRLPLMYRVQAVGGTAPRTLGYLKPDAALKIDSKIGQVVGVVGESTIDPTLRLNIITPLRVDTLEPAAAPAAPASDAPKDPAPQATGG